MDLVYVRAAPCVVEGVPDVQVMVSMVRVSESVSPRLVVPDVGVTRLTCASLAGIMV